MPSSCTHTHTANNASFRSINSSIDTPLVRRPKLRGKKVVALDARESSNIRGTSYWGVIIGGMYAFDCPTGQLLWSRRLESTTGSHPVVSSVNDTSVVFVSSKSSAVYAFAAPTGDILWKTVIDGGAVTKPTLDATVKASHNASSLSDVKTIFVGKTFQ